jgi:hypothetical protein
MPDQKSNAATKEGGERGTRFDHRRLTPTKIAL